MATWSQQRDEPDFELGERVIVNTPIAYLSGVIVGMMSILAMREHFVEVPVTYIVDVEHYKNPVYVGAMELIHGRTWEMWR